MVKEIFQLRIEVCGTEPLVWRCLQVERRMSFFELHHTIQVALGWHNKRDFDFCLEGYHISEDGYHKAYIIRPMEITVGDIVAVGDEFSYHYHSHIFHDHKIVVEKCIRREYRVVYPYCKAGEYNCFVQSESDLVPFSRMAVNFQLANLTCYIIDWIRQQKD
ncbi:MAG: plasmid pRiA4b ORF-3 family protein [Chitinophagaceae bacterium]